jgi:hypothetical protein
LLPESIIQLSGAILIRKDPAMRNQKRLVFIVVGLIIFSLACRPLRGPSEPTSDPTLAPEQSTEAVAVAAATATPRVISPTPTPAPPTATPRPKGGGLQVINDTDRDIWYLYLSPADHTEWGEDRLGGNTIPAGESFTVTGIPNGEYDVQARDVYDESIQTVWGLQVTSDTVWRVTAKAVLEITNSSETEIGMLYLSPVDSDSWGWDILDGEVIPPYGSYLIEEIDPGSYDVRVEDVDEKLLEAVYNVHLDGDHFWNVVGMANLPANAVLRFEEDFANNRNNWGLSSPSGAIFRPPANGEFCIEITENNMTAWEWYEPFRPDQFVAEVSCTLDSYSDASCGLGFGPDATNLYWFEVSPNDQTFALFLLLNGEWQPALIEWTTSKNISPQGWNYISLERVNRVVSVFINGVLQGEVSSDHFVTGRIGLGGSTYDQAYITICMDNLRVWRME